MLFLRIFALEISCLTFYYNKSYSVLKVYLVSNYYKTDYIYVGTHSIIVCSKNVTIQHTKYIAEDSFFCGHRWG